MVRKYKTLLDTRLQPAEEPAPVDSTSLVQAFSKISEDCLNRKNINSSCFFILLNPKWNFIQF